MRGGRREIKGGPNAVTTNYTPDSAWVPSRGTAPPGYYSCARPPCAMATTHLGAGAAHAKTTSRAARLATGCDCDVRERDGLFSG